jgi:hypothetical protein
MTDSHSGGESQAMTQGADQQPQELTQALSRPAQPAQQWTWWVAEQRRASPNLLILRPAGEMTRPSMGDSHRPAPSTRTRFIAKAPVPCTFR